MAMHYGCKGLSLVWEWRGIGEQGAGKGTAVAAMLILPASKSSRRVISCRAYSPYERGREVGGRPSVSGLCERGWSPVESAQQFGYCTRQPTRCSGGRWTEAPRGTAVAQRIIRCLRRPTSNMMKYPQTVVCRGGRRADPLRTGRKHSGRAGNLALQRQVPGQFLGDFGAI